MRYGLSGTTGRHMPPTVGLPPGHVFVHWLVIMSGACPWGQLAFGWAGEGLGDGEGLGIGGKPGMPGKPPGRPLGTQAPKMGSLT